MRLSGSYLLLGLALGLLTSFWQPGGRWDLVWAHALLVGFFLSMVSGVCYHVLTRWTDRRWRSLAPLRLHFAVVALGLPLMLLALATNQALLFAIAGPLQAVAIALLLVNIVPFVSALPHLTRPAFAVAMALLLVGITLGALFAIDPALGARLRLTHTEINLFGWSGLLISGAGYYLVPRFAGQPLRWSCLAPVQLTLLATGIILGALALAWRAYGDGPAALVLAAQLLVATGYLLFGILVAGTFFAPRKRAGAVAALSLAPRPATGAPQG
jgi:cbb3-type cytochrome oxidase subunit 1